MNLIKPFTAILPQGYICSKSTFLLPFFFLSPTHPLHSDLLPKQRTSISSNPALQSPSSQKNLVSNQIIMFQKQIDSCAANRLETPTIWSLLLTRYHYDLQVKDNSRTYPGFAFNFGLPPKRPMRVISSPDLTIIPCEIMANSHAFCGTSYKGIGAAIRYNMMNNITYIDAEGHGACFSNI